MYLCVCLPQWPSGKQDSCNAGDTGLVGREDPLEEEMATHSSILAWKFPWAEEPGGLQPKGWQESDVTQQAHPHASTHRYVCP